VVAIPLVSKWLLALATDVVAPTTLDG